MISSLYCLAFQRRGQGHSIRTCMQNGPRPLSRERRFYYVNHFFIGKYMLSSLKNKVSIKNVYAHGLLGPPWPLGPPGPPGPPRPPGPPEMSSGLLSLLGRLGLPGLLRCPGPPRASSGLLGLLGLLGCVAWRFPGPPRAASGSPCRSSLCILCARSDRGPVSSQEKRRGHALYALQP